MCMHVHAHTKVLFCHKFELQSIDIMVYVTSSSYRR